MSHTAEPSLRVRGGCFSLFISDLLHHIMTVCNCKQGQISSKMLVLCIVECNIKALTVDSCFNFAINDVISLVIFNEVNQFRREKC